MNLFYRNPWLTGLIGGLALVAFYLGLLSLLNSPFHAIQQFLDMWYWVLALAVGFGIQIGLYAYVLRARHKMSVGMTTGMAASCGISSMSMIACCAHHVFDIFPLLGMAALSTFLVKYQTAFLLIGVLSNIIGIALMLNTIQKEKVWEGSQALQKIMRYDMGLLLKSVVVGAVVLLAYFLMSLLRNT